MKLAKGMEPLLKQHCALLVEMRHLVATLVPDDFAWRLELGSGMQCAVIFWAKMAQAAHVGRVSDADWSVCIYLLERVDWYDYRYRSGLDTLRRDKGQPSAPLGVRPDGAAAVGVVHSVEAKPLPRREGRWF